MANDEKKDFTNEEKREFVKKIFAFTQQYANNDLFKFFVKEDHRLIHKWVNYFPVYEKWFKDFRDTDVVFVEVGVYEGGSLQMWKNYFGKKAKIIGVDINEHCKNFEEEQITVEIGSQEDPNFWSNFRKKYPRVDILLDDGGHTMNQQKVTFKEMFPHIKDGGIYMCEDCHTSYSSDPRWGGGGDVITFIEFSKNLIDTINAFFTGNSDYLSRNMGGIHFYSSIVVVEKSFLPFKPFGLKIGEPTYTKK